MGRNSLQPTGLDYYLYSSVQGNQNFGKGIDLYHLSCKTVYEFFFSKVYM